MPTWGPDRQDDPRTGGGVLLPARACTSEVGAVQASNPASVAPAAAVTTVDLGLGMFAIAATPTPIRLSGGTQRRPHRGESAREQGNCRAASPKRNPNEDVFVIATDPRSL